MAPSNRNLSLLSFSALKNLIERSSKLEGEQVLNFSRELHGVAMYCAEVSLQAAHAQALLERIRDSRDLEEMAALSRLQEKIPHFLRCAELQVSFARGLVLRARRTRGDLVFRDFLSRIFQLSHFATSEAIQECAALLYVQSIAACASPAEAEDLARQLASLPLAGQSHKLGVLIAKGQELIHQPPPGSIVKVDLNEKMRAPLRAIGKLVGMGDYRMRVSLPNSPKYKQVVVRVPAFTEQAARRSVESFMKEFIEEYVPGGDCTAEILDIFPPGSPWESGRHPVLKLS